MKEVYISLGSNLGNRLDFINKALNILKEQKDVKINKASSFYETEPVGYKNQGKFINAVISLETTQLPSKHLLLLQSIESRLKRVRDTRWGPRTIDLDILFYGDLVLKSDVLTLPHPRLTERAFVLIPLAEIAPSFVHPVTGKTVSRHLRELHDTGGVYKLTGTEIKDMKETNLKGCF